jgi:hypothetical protein
LVWTTRIARHPPFLKYKLLLCSSTSTCILRVIKQMVRQFG